MGGKGSTGKAPYQDQLTGAGADYLTKRLKQPDQQINVPTMGGLTQQIGSNIASMPKLPQYQALQVDPNQFKTLQDIGQTQIAQQAKASQQDILRQMGQRGLGQSGLAAQAVMDQYQRGAGQDTANLANQLQSQRLGLQFGEQQQARNLNAQNDLNQAQLGLQGQLGLGQLGLGEQAQNLAKLSTQFSQNNYMTPIMAALAQTGIQAAASQGSGKGGKG